MRGILCTAVVSYTEKNNEIEQIKLPRIRTHYMYPFTSVKILQNVSLNKLVSLIWNALAHRGNMRIRIAYLFEVIKCM